MNKKQEGVPNTKRQKSAGPNSAQARKPKKK